MPPTQAHRWERHSTLYPTLSTGSHIVDLADAAGTCAVTGGITDSQTKLSMASYHLDLAGAADSCWSWKRLSTLSPILSMASHISTVASAASTSEQMIEITCP